VLGWFHESQYRGDEPYQKRLGHVQTIYTGPGNEQVALLTEYDVEYVYVGPTERSKYGQITVDDLTGVEPVHRSGDVVIYEVDQDALP